MARRRHQTGRVIVRGKKPPVFVGRWREDVIQGDHTVRVERSMVLGTVAELKTKRIAQRLLDPILARINSFDYRPSKFISVEKFADMWETQVLIHQKPSSINAAKSHLRTYIRKHLGKVLLHEFTPQIQQAFVTLLAQKASRKTVLNVLGTLSSMMRTAKSWGYCTQAITTSELALPTDEIRKQTRFFNGQETRKIITAASEPYRTMFAIAAMTGLRAGEVMGLQKGRSRPRAAHNPRQAVRLAWQGADGEEQGESGSGSDARSASHNTEGVLGKVAGQSRRLSFPQPQREAVRAEQSGRIRPMACLDQAKDRARRHACVSALPREFIDGCRSESGGHERADATLGCAHYAGSLQSRNWRFTAQCGGQSGRNSAPRCAQTGDIR